MASVGHFAGNFLDAFSRAKQFKRQQDQDEQEKKARLKLFEIQLEREKLAQQSQQRALEAQGKIFDRLRGVETLPGTGVQVMDPRAAPSLTDLLADPESAMLLLQSGLVKGDDIIKQQDSAANRAMMQNLLGGGTSSGAPASGLELSALKIGPSGELMPDFSRPQIWQEVPSPDGKEMIQIDRFGRVMGRRPAAPAERQPTEEDKRKRDVAAALDVYEQAKQGLLEGLEGTVTGPLIGNLPAITSAQQTAQGGVAAMAPVLKQLFRAAGEGVFTDRDQQLLIEMIPTRETNPAARKAMIENIDAIVRAKLGLTAPAQGNVVDFSELPE